MKNRKRVLEHQGLFLLAISICLLMFSSNTHARTYDIYVDASNTGTEDGSADNPYNTITEALAGASENDKILIKNGTYTEHIEIPRNVDVYGEDKKGVIIDGDSTGTTVKMNHKSKLKKVTVKGGNTGIKVPEKAGVKIIEVKVKKADHDGIVLEGSSRTRKKDRYEREIRECSIKDNGDKGIYIKKSQVIIEDSKIYDNEEEGIDMRKSVKVTIEDNIIKNNGESNIEFKIDDVDLEIIDNKIKKSDRSGISAQSYQGTKGVISIFGNSIKDNDHYGLRCSIQNHAPVGGWSGQLFLGGNTFDDNTKGQFSSACRF
ncbi:MAG: right-handed parallel beta-helix repeat-containing protein [Patescibacteria group bacterium]|nr:right-handed parallel beta-helix repeat-containing protein [Patescibacteria group bacterium]